MNSGLYVFVIEGKNNTVHALVWLTLLSIEVWVNKSVQEQETQREKERESERVAHICSESVRVSGRWLGREVAGAIKNLRCFQRMMGISGTFPKAVKSSAFPAPLNTPSSLLHPARVPIKQLRRLVFGNSCHLKGVIKSWKKNSIYCQSLLTQWTGGPAVGSVKWTLMWCLMCCNPIKLKYMWFNMDSNRRCFQGVISEDAS